MLKKSKGNRFHQQGFIFSTFPINFIICLTPYRKASITGAFFIFKRKENIMGVRVVFPDMGKDPSVQLIEKTITENGTYDAITDGANGYSKVNVNVEGGGGGSSDFSTAQVTIVNNSQSDAFHFIMAVAMTHESMSATTGIVLGTPVGETEIFNVALYKGNAHIQFGSDEPLIITTSGNISDIGGGNYMVTGDCTITIS